MNSVPELKVVPTPRPIPRRYRIGDLLLDVGTARVTRDGVDLPVRGLSFDLLHALARAAPLVVSHNDLLRSVWPGLVVGPDTLSQRVKLMREAIGDDSQEPRYVLGVRGRGYRLIPRVEVADEAALDGFAAPERVATPSADMAAARPAVAPSLVPLPSPPRAKALVAASLVAALIVVTAGFFIVRELQPKSAAPAADSSAPTWPEGTLVSNAVAVLPFEMIGGTSQDVYIGRGLAEMILTRLGEVPSLVVLARSSTFALEGQSIDDREVGQRLGARFIVRGAVQKMGDDLRVTAQLIDAKEGLTVHALKVDRPAANLFAMQDEVALGIASALDVSLSTRAPLTASTDAYLEFLRGLDALARWRVAPVEAAIWHFQKARQLDPGFASAYALEAQSILRLSQLRTLRAIDAAPQAEPLIEKAVALDPDLGIAYILRAELAQGHVNDENLQRGLSLAPSSVEGYMLLATRLSDEERFAEAIAASGRAVQLDPFQPRPRYLNALLHYLSDQDSDAFEARLIDILRIDPQYTQALNRLAQLRWRSHGALAEAIALIEQAIASDPESQYARLIAADLYLALQDAPAAEHVLATLPLTGPEIRPARAAVAIVKGERRATARALLEYARSGASPTVAEMTAGFVTDLVINVAIHDAAVASGEAAVALGALGFDPCLVRRGKDSCLDVRSVHVMAPLARLQLASSDGPEGAGIARRSLEFLDESIARGTITASKAAPHKAMALAALGRDSEALEVLYEARSEPQLMGWLFVLENDSTFDGMHSDTRFQAILSAARANLARERAKLDAIRRDDRAPRRPPVSG